jgi:hypothetical protein
VIAILHAEHTPRSHLTGNTALRSHDRTHHRRDSVPRCGIFGHLRDRCVDQEASQATATALAVAENNPTIGSVLKFAEVKHVWCRP